MRSALPLAVLFFALVTGLAAPPAARPRHSEVAPAAAKLLTRLPLNFEANHGQADPATQFLVRTGGGSASFDRHGALLQLNASPGTEPPARTAAVRIGLRGANPAVTATAGEPLAGKVNYFVGNDPAKWRRSIPTFKQVRYDQVYRGIDLVYHGEQGRLEYDFVVALGGPRSRERQRRPAPGMSRGLSRGER
jgi:hypothetical protein